MKSGLGWPIGVGVILAATVASNLVVMRIASNDPSFAVEPDYYRKAVAYDSTMSAARESEQLGWTGSATITPDSAGISHLVVRLDDRDGAPVTDAVVTSVAIFVARANQPDTLVMVGDGAGAYRASLARAHVGQWEVRLIAHRGADRFTRVLRTEATSVAAQSITR